MNHLRLLDSADWYKLTTMSPGTEINAVSIAFQNRQGALNLEVYDAASRLAGQSTDTSRTASAESVGLSSNPAGTYYVRVFANWPSNYSPDYSLTIDPPPADDP